MFVEFLGVVGKIERKVFVRRYGYGVLVLCCVIVLVCDDFVLVV